MHRAERGVIVNISSVNGQNPAALVAAYNAAKAGVISLTRTLALELAACGVRVNCVCPGPVYTDFNRRVMAQRCAKLGISESQLIERVRGSIPLGRWGEPEDIARAVAFLCSPASAWITGEVLRVSGGLEGVSAALPKATIASRPDPAPASLAARHPRSAPDSG
jgi:NAD(P)-dependent dehydrogenase (short-subunit alcohol dehydrogenase family)